MTTVIDTRAEPRPQPAVAAPPAPLPAAPGPTVRRLLGEQTVVLLGQGIAGLGNLAFLLVAVRLLPSSEFAELATFQALYLLLLMPTLGLSAGASAAPEAIGAAQRRTMYVAGALAVGFAAASLPIGAGLQLPWLLVILLGLTLPAAGPLALARGRLYGRARHLGVGASLVAEPAVRLGAGIPLMAAAGPVGGGLGVVLGSYAALALAWLAGRRRVARHSANLPVTTTSRRLPWLTVAGFTLLAVVQNQDLVIANKLLPGSAAGEFAALSAVGGIAAFATSTVPLVLLPRLSAGPAGARRALRVALAIAGGLGVVAVLVGAVAPAAWYRGLLGARYSAVAGLAGPYLAAMALLGVGRVLAARVLAAGRRRRAAAAICVVAVAVQATSICLAPRTPRAVALSTLLATAVLAGGLTGLAAVPTGWRQRLATRLRTRDAIVTAAALTAITVLALVLRLLITRGLWLDEATSVTQAKMSFAGMLHNLRTSDVHPPGYFSVLWAWIRVFGDGPLSVRMPSVLLGVATVPVVFFAARDIYGRRTAWVAAIFAMVAPQMVWYSQEARMYALFMLLVVLAVWAQVRALRSGSWRAWIALGVVSAAMMWTQYFTILVILAQQLIVAVVVGLRLRRRQPVGPLLLRWAASLAVFGLLIAPVIPFAHDQFAANQAAGRGFNTPTAAGAGATQPGGGLSAYILIANLLWAVWGYQPTSVMTALGALWPIGMLLVLLLLGRGRSRRTVMLLVVALLPIAVVFGIATQKRFLFDLRYFIGAVPLLAIVAARAAATWPKRRIGVVALTGVLTASLAVGLGDQQLNGNNPRRYDFAPALRLIAANTRPGDQVILAPPYLNDLSHYYQPQLADVPARGGSRSIVLSTASDRRVFLLGSFFENPGQSRQIAQLLAGLSSRRTLLHRWRLSNVRVWEFQ